MRLAGYRRRTVIYLYPMTGRPGVNLPDGWDDIPGARGCTPESCGFGDLMAGLAQAGAARVFGLSSQSTGYQREAVSRLHLPFSMLSGEGLALAAAPGLPTFGVDGTTLYRRLTMIITDGGHRARLPPRRPARPARPAGAGLAARPPAALVPGGRAWPPRPARRGSGQDRPGAGSGQGATDS